MDSLASCVQYWASNDVGGNHTQQFSQSGPRDLVRSPTHCFWLVHPYQLQSGAVRLPHLFVAAPLPPLHHHLLFPLLSCCCCSLSRVLQEAADPQESPYFDSLCRSFLLGVGAGALVETVHMVSKLVQTPDVQGECLLASSSQAGGEQSPMMCSVSGFWPAAAERVVKAVIIDPPSPLCPVLRLPPACADLMASTPLFLWDHVAAVVFWVALYGVEVALILSVYARYPDSEQAVSALCLRLCAHLKPACSCQARQHRSRRLRRHDSVSPVDQPASEVCP